MSAMSEQVTDASEGTWPHKWLTAAGLTTNNLTADEADELDTMIFRKNCDYPYSQERIDELRAKTEQAA